MGFIGFRALHPKPPVPVSGELGVLQSPWGFVRSFVQYIRIRSWQE